MNDASNRLLELDGLDKKALKEEYKEFAKKDRLEGIIKKVWNLISSLDYWGWLIEPLSRPNQSNLRYESSDEGDAARIL